MRITFTCLSLISLFLLPGCGTRDSTDSQQQETAQSEPQTPAIPQVPQTSSDATSPEATFPTATPDVAQDEMAGADAKKAGDAANNYPHEQLVAAAGNTGLTRAYKSCEDQLRETPQDTDQQMQRAYLLLSAGTMLMAKQDGEQAILAFRAAFERAQQLVKENPSLPHHYHKPLANIYYNGACADSLDGKADIAKTTLQQAVDWGWSDMEALRNDPDLANVRALAGFDAELDGWVEAARQALLKQAREELAAGETFPLDFTVTDLAGTELKLADLKGKVVIVDFWGTWCPPCRAEIPSFIKLQEQFGERGLQIVGLNFENAPDDEAKAKLAQDFIDANGVNYPCALGTDEIMAQVPEFGGYPTTLFIDRSGKVRLKIVGLHDYAYLESLVLALLDEETASPSGETPGTP